MDHYKHITIDERETIFLMRNHGNSLREIASHIKKSYSTISRELSRNSTGKSYSPSKAQEKYKQRKGNCGRVSLLSNPQVFEVVREHFCEDLGLRRKYRIAWQSKSIRCRSVPRLFTVGFSMAYLIICLNLAALVPCAI